MELLTKKEIIEKLKKIKAMEWIPNARKGNAGGVGNTLEDMLGIKENNLPIPNAAEWELKCQRKDSSSLGTLFHMEPSPRAVKFVPRVFLANYSWAHQKAGTKYPKTERSFRQTINTTSRSDRWFTVVLDRKEQKVKISFDSSFIDDKHLQWKQEVSSKASLLELNPQPYWGFQDLIHKAGTKLKNCFFIVADSKTEKKIEYFSYNTIFMLQDFDGEKFISEIENGNIYVDFDARTGHNHGTKFRVKNIKVMKLLYKNSREING
ncbi:MAG: MvaI/BcnI family restriction endonuclease [Sedimentisphaerales bacterium]